MSKQSVLQDLKGFVAVKSISSNPEYKPEIEKAAHFLKQKLEQMDFTVQVFHTDGSPPLLIATRIKNPKGKTIGIYGHYDVQPEDPVAEWKTPPFDLTVKNGKMWGRGVADNKGHIIQNISALDELIKEKKLQNNIVFILEGEEEVGSAHYEKYMEMAKKVLKQVDVFYITDTGMHDKNKPQIFYGLRGLVYFELEVMIGDRDLHSGVYGNRVLNPINVLGDLIGKIKDVRTGKVLLPGFYTKVRKIPAHELKILDLAKRSVEDERKEANVYRIVSVDGLHPSLVTKIYPSFDCHGIVGGYTGPGPKTVIPRTAKVKFSSRLVEHQDPQEVLGMFKTFIKKTLPDGVKYNLTVISDDAPFYTDINNEYVKKTANILERIFGNKILFNRSGGSIPAAEVLQRIYKKPIILTGFTLPDDNIHSPNENFDEEMFWKGIEALKRLYSA